jgi:magnesium chelatase family protein
MLAIIHSASLVGIDAVPVQVEVNTGESGEPKLILVGLPDAAVKESDDRVFSALSNSGFRAPRTRTTINLAPGDLHKEGPLYDLPIALGILAATGQLQTDRLDRLVVAGELSLSGATRPVKGGLAIALLARTGGKPTVLLPPVSAQEAALVEGVTVHQVDSLDAAVRFLEGRHPLPAVPSRTAGPARPPELPDGVPDFSEIKGQHAVRRAVEVAVAGGHNVLILCVISYTQRFLHFDAA